MPAGTHIAAPVTRWGGPLVLLALLRWRRPEARPLVALACVPHSPLLYEAVPLFLIVRTFEEGLLLSFLTFSVSVAMQLQGPLAYEAWMAASGQWIVWLLYVPALAMVLRRPNVAPNTVTETSPVRGSEVGRP